MSGEPLGSLGIAPGVELGALLDGKYHVERVLGHGGMGVVVAAHHVHLDEMVAIKFLRPEILNDAEAVGRFMREARAAVKIRSEHVARVTDVGKLSNGVPYMVLEYLEGVDLGKWLEGGNRPPIPTLIDAVLQACEAIAEAHRLGIVHRDLKPSNLFFTQRPDGSPSIKVLDFGISKMSSTSQEGAELGLTKTTAVFGSPLYMSPEQLRSARSVDHRTDIWSLGVILYELIAGKVPFDGEAYSNICIAIATAAPPELGVLRQDVPRPLEQVILKCLKKERDERYANLAELARALAPFATPGGAASVERIERILGATGISSGNDTPQPGMVPSSGSGTSETAASWGQTTAPPTRSKKVPIILGLVLGGLATLGVVVVRVLGESRVEGAPSAGSVVKAPPDGAPPSPRGAETAALGESVRDRTLHEMAVAPSATPRPLASPRPSAAPSPSSGVATSSSDNGGLVGSPTATPQRRPNVTRVTTASSQGKATTRPSAVTNTAAAASSRPASATAQKPSVFDERR